MQLAQTHYAMSQDINTSQEEFEHAKEEKYSGDEDSSEFVDYPFRSPPLKSSNIPTTPLRTPSIKSPVSSSKRKSLFERRGKRNSRLFSSHLGGDNTKLFNDTLNLDDNDDILDFDQSMLPRLDHSPERWNKKFSTNGAMEIEELKKKVTGYQLQIRLIMEFLQKNGTADLLTKLESENFSFTSCKNCDEKDQEKQELIVELSTSRTNYKKIEGKLALYQDQLNITNDQLQALLQALNELEDLIDDTLNVLETDSNDELKKEIENVRDSDINTKLTILLSVSSELLRTKIVDEFSANTLTNTPKRNFTDLEAKLDLSERQLQNLKLHLTDTIDESKLILDSYTNLKTAYQKQSEKLKSLESKVRDQSQNGRLRSESTTSSVQTREPSESLVNHLKTLNLSHDTLVTPIELNPKLKELENELLELRQQLLQKHQELLDIKQDFSYHQTKLSMKLEEDEAKLKNLWKELQTTLEKEKLLSAEIFKLKQDLKSVQQQAQHLQLELDREDTQHDGEFWNLKYEELLLSDTKIANKFLNIFEEILDSQSIEQARVKIYELANRSTLAEDQRKSKELHESIFQYYVSGSQAIVNDYLSLIEQLEMVEKEKNLKILNLTNELKKLRHNINENDENILKLRIEDLTKKWKLERESRKSEGDNLQRRLAELENENLQLKLRLEEISRDE